MTNWRRDNNFKLRSYLSLKRETITYNNNKEMLICVEDEHWVYIENV